MKVEGKTTMEALVAVEKEGTRLNGKYESCRKSSTKLINELIEHVESVKKGLCEVCQE